MERGHPSGVVTCVFTDIEGSAELSERYRAAFEPLRQQHFRILRQAAEELGGYEVSTAGDSLFLVFQQPSDALRWAERAQQDLHAVDWAAVPARGGPEEPVHLTIRIGIHTGEAYIDAAERANYYGPVVNRAARVMSAAHGGQVLASAAARELTCHDFEYADLGTHRLKSVGEERLYQLLVPGLPREFPTLNTLSSRRHNLPLQLTAFLGREDELAEIQAKLASPSARLVTLAAFGGMGKTRTALQVAEQCVDEYAAGVWWVALDDAYTGADLLQQIAGALALQPQSSTPLRDQIHSYLRDRELLLVLDNAEQVADAGAEVHRLLTAASALKCLVTSRRPLGIRGEIVVELPAMPTPDAVRLFLDRARSVSASLTEDRETVKAAEELCVRLEGIPLAIELAAARAVALSPRQMLQRLGERFRLLQARAPDLPERQRALRAAIDWSYNLLTAEERALFAQLSVFAGEFTVEDAEAFCEAFDVLESLAEIRRHSLLRSQSGAEARFSMLESLREYAAERLAETPDRGAAVRERHCSRYRSRAAEWLAALRGPGEPAALRELEQSLPNLRAAADWAHSAGKVAEAGELDLALGSALQRMGFTARSVEMVERGLALSSSLAEEPRLLARLKAERAGLHIDLGELDAATDMAGRAKAVFASEGDVAGQAQACNLTGWAAMARGEFGDARRWYGEALTLANQAGSVTMAAIVQNNLGLVERRDHDGDKARARTHLEDALRLWTEANDLRGMAEATNNLGVLAQDAGEFEEARGRYEASLAHERKLGHRFGIARAQCNLGEIAEATGDPPLAKELYTDAERRFRDIGSPYAAYAAERLAGLAEG